MFLYDPVAKQNYMYDSTSIKKAETRVFISNHTLKEIRSKIVYTGLYFLKECKDIKVYFGDRVSIQNTPLITTTTLRQMVINKIDPMASVRMMKNNVVADVFFKELKTKRYYIYPKRETEDGLEQYCKDNDIPMLPGAMLVNEADSLTLILAGFVKRVIDTNIVLKDFLEFDDFEEYRCTPE